ncbi:unnamed protein product [Prunus armeniaca]
MVHRVWKVAKSVLKTTSRALMFRRKSKQLEVCKPAGDPAKKKQKKKIKEEMDLMKPKFRANDPLYCKDEVAVDAAKRLKKEAGYSGDTSSSSSSPSLSLSSSSLFLLPSSLHLLLHGVFSHGCREKPRTSKLFPWLPWGRLTPLTPWWSHMPGFGKLSPTWEGPYMIYKILGKGAYLLEDRDGETHHTPIRLM